MIDNINVYSEEGCESPSSFISMKKFMDPWNNPFRTTGQKCWRCMNDPILMYSRDEETLSCSCNCGNEIVHNVDHTDMLLDINFTIESYNITNEWNIKYGYETF